MKSFKLENIIIKMLCIVYYLKTKTSCKEICSINIVSDSYYQRGKNYSKDVNISVYIFSANILQINILLKNWFSKKTWHLLILKQN